MWRVQGSKSSGFRLWASSARSTELGYRVEGLAQRKCRKAGVVENSRRGYLQYLVQGVRWIESKVTGKGMGLGTGMQVTVLGWV